MSKTNFWITFVIGCQKANFWFCTQNYLLGVQNLIFDSQKQLKSAKNLFLQVLCTQKLVLDTQKLLLGTKPTICFFASNHKSYQKFCFWHVLDNFCRRRSDPLLITAIEQTILEAINKRKRWKVMPDKSYQKT